MLLLLVSCKGSHLIHNKEYLAVIKKSFNEREQLCKNRENALFSVFHKKLTLKQRDALEFLYAFMPLNDLADYDGEFFLANINTSLKAKEVSSWSKDIPEEIFLHYVLPPRVNNENLDSFRIVYYDEISERVKGKNITEAALEINHWCHEKVSYQAADSRTSAPMSTILSARGRCGEESTLTVAALRTAGIPARQVYTPRWAHTDDNHAWVEIWQNGNWYYMGACEPEPGIDQGWFTEPARRAMLIHTKSFGAPFGNENAVTNHKNFTEVNNLSKYAVTKRIFVKILDKNGAPVNNANVEYQLYNYAEFYPLAVVPTDKNGMSRFETGMGDLLIWASKEDDYDFKKISVTETDTLTLRLIRKPVENSFEEFDLDVPIIRSPYAGPSPELVAKNSERIKDENTIRQKYIDSWTKPETVRSIASRLKYDTAAITNVIARSMGNYGEITSFLLSVPDSLVHGAISLLELLPDKDLRDTKASILVDQLLNSFSLSGKNGEFDNNMFLSYILNPRISNEIIVAWRGYFRNKLPSDLLKNAPLDPSLITSYLVHNVKITEDENYYATSLTPKGVNELRVSDIASRSICFVAICRTLGIPSRLEPGTNVPQYFFNESWNDVYFTGQVQDIRKNGFLKLQSSEKNPVPEYYIHFTLARFENGHYNTLEYDFNKRITDFKEELPLPSGDYMIVTGRRIDGGKVLSDISFFNLAQDEHKTIDIKLRKDASKRRMFGKIDLKAFTESIAVIGNIQLKPEEKGVVIIWVEPDKEPSRHIFYDLPHLKKELDAWGGPFLFLSGSIQDTNVLNKKKFRELPANSVFGFDSKMNALNTFAAANNISDLSFPLVVVADNQGNILNVSAGYRIGTADMILKQLLTTVDI